MGPRLLGRGNYLVIGSANAIVALQWGRVCWDAEMTRRDKTRPDRTRPSMGPRLLGRGNPLDGPFLHVVGHLQWGRVCWDAEMRYCDESDVPQGVPSMGPRLLGRGNICRVMAVVAIRMAFNGAASVGTRKWAMSPPARPTLFRLQWGRVCWDAEIDLVLARRWLEWSTSMGPRLLGRGNDSRISARRPAGGHFNGAASVGTRKSVFPIHERVAEPTSMGPRLLGRGNPSCQEPCGSGIGTLQWGRVCWDAEMRRTAW